MLVVVTSPERHARVYGMQDGSHGNPALSYDRDGSIGRPAPGRGPDPLADPSLSSGHRGSRQSA